jgi:hypothetical protein
MSSPFRSVVLAACLTVLGCTATTDVQSGIESVTSASAGHRIARRWPADSPLHASARITEPRTQASLQFDA